jgi:hypothetical protein
VTSRIKSIMHAQLQIIRSWWTQAHTITTVMFFILLYGLRLRLWTAAPNGHTVHPLHELESNGGMILTGENRRTRRKNCPSATLSTTNPTWIDLGANPGLCGERPATNLRNGVTTTDILYLLISHLPFVVKLRPHPQRLCTKYGVDRRNARLT